MKTTRKEYTSSILEDLLNVNNKSISKKINAKMELAAAIDDAIKAKGWNKIKFAEEIKQNPSVITKWLSGTHNFTVDTLIDIGIALDVDLININKVSNDLVVQPFFIEINSENFEKCIADSCLNFTTSFMTSGVKTVQSSSKKYSALNS